MRNAVEDLFISYDDNHYTTDTSICIIIIIIIIIVIIAIALHVISFPKHWIIFV